MNKFEKNQDLIASVVDMSSEGMGIVKVDQFPFFVDASILGEKILFKIVKLKKNYGYGKLLKVIEKSPHRVEPLDDFGRQVGILSFQHIDYDYQLEIKKKLVENAFSRIGGFKDLNIENTIGMENPLRYRNKSQIPVREIEGRLETGLFRRASNELIPLEDYYLPHKEIDELILKVRDILRKYKVPAYDDRTHKGLIRHIIVKRGYYTGQMMLVLVTRSEHIAGKDKIIEEIAELSPDLVSITQNIQDKKTNVILGNKTITLYGKDFYQDKILGYLFNIDSKSFFQVNTRQAEVLYQKAINLAQLQGDEIVLDAYCGIGSISLALSSHCKKVYGVEVVKEAIDMANINKELNSVDNVEFLLGKAEDVLSQWAKESKHFDLVFVDPPRKGLDNKFLQALDKIKPEKIVYISCNPSSQARDCKYLREAGYQVKNLVPVDMFPMTFHVESVALLERIDK